MLSDIADRLFKPNATWQSLLAFDVCRQNSPGVSIRPAVIVIGSVAPRRANREGLTGLGCIDTCVKGDFRKGTEENTIGPNWSRFASRFLREEDTDNSNKKGHKRIIDRYCRRRKRRKLICFVSAIRDLISEREREFKAEKVRKKTSQNRLTNLNYTFRKVDTKITGNFFSSSTFFRLKEP